MSKGAQILSELSRQFAQIAPEAALALGVLTGGLLLSTLAKRVAGWLVRKSGLELLAERAGAAKLLYRLGMQEGITPLVQRLVWYGCLLMTFASLAEILGLGSVQAGIGVVVAFLPRLLAGCLVLFGGLWIAGFLRSLLQGLAKKEGELDSPNTVGQVVYFAVLTISATLALGQAGIEVRLMESLLQLVCGAAVFAMALAFALGGKDVFGNLVARHYYSTLIAPGDRLKLNGLEGVVVRLTPVAVIVSTAEAEHVIPCSLLLSSVPEIRRFSGDL